MIYGGLAMLAAGVGTQYAMKFTFSDNVKGSGVGTTSNATKGDADKSSIGAQTREEDRSSSDSSSSSSTYKSTSSSRAYESKVDARRSSANTGSTSSSTTGSEVFFLYMAFINVLMSFHIIVVTVIIITVTVSIAIIYLVIMIINNDSYQVGKESGKGFWDTLFARSFYDGGFEEKMTKREAALILGTYVNDHLLSIRVVIIHYHVIICSYHLLHLYHRRDYCNNTFMS